MNKYNIDYYLYAGTMLGAVRHKGFIPWDDDIDIILTRPNYDRLVKVLKEKNNRLDESIYAEGYELGNSYDWPFIKIFNSNIKLKSENGLNNNLWIDVFVYDGIKENRKIYFFMVRIIRKLLVFKKVSIYDGNVNRTNNYKKMEDFIFKFMGRMFSIRFIMKKYYKLCRRYNYDKCNYVCDIIWGSKESNKIPKEWLEISEFEFEGKKYKGFKEYDKILTTIYGDYMKLPPEDQRITHSFEAYKIEKERRL